MKIFIFRIYYKDKIMGQAIHWKEKGCLVRFADAHSQYISSFTACFIGSAITMCSIELSGVTRPLLV